MIINENALLISASFNQEGIFASGTPVEWKMGKMAGMGLHRIESIMDGMTLTLPTKLKSKISARAKSLIETAACTHSRIQDV